MTIVEVKAQHPFPWRYNMIGNQAFLFDANGSEVPLFLMLDFICSLTAMLEKNMQQEAQPAPA